MPNKSQSARMSQDDKTSATKPFLAQLLLYLGVAGTPGALAALIATGLEKGFHWTILGLCAAFTLGGFLLVRYALKIGNFDPPSFTSKAGRNQAILLFSAFVGVLIGIYLNATRRAGQIVEGTFTLSSGEAIGGLAILLAFLPIVYFWHRSIDEHEAASVNSAAMISLYIYFYGYTAWTLASYANLMPPMNDIVLFFAVIFATLRLLL